MLPFEDYLTPIVCGIRKRDQPAIIESPFKLHFKMSFSMLAKHRKYRIKAFLIIEPGCPGIGFYVFLL